MAKKLTEAELEALRLQALIEQQNGNPVVMGADGRIPMDLQQKPGLRLTIDGNRGAALTVENYLKMRQLSKQSVEGDGVEMGDEMLTDKALARARVYHLDQITYATFYRQVDVWIENTVYGIEWKPYGVGEPPPEADVENTLKLARFGEGTPVPDFPFPDVYFGFGSGVGLALHHMEQRGIELGWGIIDALLLGILVVVDGKQVYEMIKVDLDDGTTRLVSYPCRKTQDDEDEDDLPPVFGMPLPGPQDATVWRPHATFTLTPWVLLCLVSAVEKHAEPASRLVTQRMVKQHNKRTGDRLRPPKFYTVKTTTIANNTIADEVMSGSTERSSPNYRFDVRGHWRLLTKRDTEQLLTKDRLALEARGYVVGHNATELGPAIVKALLDRGLSLPSDGEWLACKLVRVKEHQRGPEEGEYIPAMRQA